MVKKHKNNNGFTLIELLIGIAIVGIISVIAVPSYQNIVQKSRRTDAMEILMRLAVLQEKFYAQHGTYTADITSASGLNNGSEYSSQGYYKIKVWPPNVDLTKSFHLLATAQGIQVNDKECTYFLIDNYNQRSSRRNIFQETTDCW